MKKEKVDGSGIVNPNEELTPLQRFQAQITTLNAERSHLATEHKEWIKKHPSQFGDLGSEDVYALSMQVIGAVKAAQAFGLIDSSLDPHSFLT